LTAEPDFVTGKMAMPEQVRPFKWYRELAERQGRLAAGAFLVEGDKAIRQVIAGNPEDIIEILAVGEAPQVYSDYPFHKVTESQFRYISRNQTPQGVMAVVRTPADIYADRLPAATGDKILLLEDIQDPGNTGTLIRTAAAFGFSGVILTESGADPLSPKVVQSTAGAMLSVWLRRMKDHLALVRVLKKEGFTLVAADLKGNVGPEALHGAKKLILALGNEAAGLSQELLDTADFRLRIPTLPEKAESLNVAACGAILMYLSTSLT
jgi:TrmH family RNA methyltransferase